MTEYDKMVQKHHDDTVRKDKGMADLFEFLTPCHFGTESVLKKEITDLGYEIKAVEDGKVSFLGDETAIPRANIFLRTTERVLLVVGRFKATSFEELFEKTIQAMRSLSGEMEI